VIPSGILTSTEVTKLRMISTVVVPSEVSASPTAALDNALTRLWGVVELSAATFTAMTEVVANTRGG